jgi:phosphoglycerate dehydrogenase-like enzyme
LSFTIVMLPPPTESSSVFAANLTRDVPGITVLTPQTRDETVQALEVAEAAFGTLPAELVRHARRLRWLQAPQAAPPAGFYTPELIAHPAQVTNMRGTYTEQVATHAVTLMLALARGLPGYAAQQSRHEWQQNLEPAHYLDLSEATTLLVGLGPVGTEIARLLRAFGGTILATDARVASAPPWVDELHPADAIDELLPRADAVILTVPHTPKTGHLFAGRRFSLMTRARLVNVGRGPVIDLDDLVTAIHDGNVASAALDVFEIEPLPADHVLWDMPEVIITPHIASAAHGKDPLRPQRYAVLLDNARRFAAGEYLRNLVDKADWF